MGLDKPVIVQYGVWLGKVVRGNFGNSTSTQTSVIKLIRQRASATGQLALGAWLFGTLVGVPLGVFSATNRGKFLD
ncbi:MAG: peptide ABC transporter, partial [Elusimicrobia bacterium CG08_land_8_20_14_0_20_59_10]